MKIDFSKVALVAGFVLAMAFTFLAPAMTAVVIITPAAVQATTAAALRLRKSRNAVTQYIIPQQRNAVAAINTLLQRNSATMAAR